MSNIKIKTLTSIHIGNGNFLQENTDFVTLPRKGKGKELYILDDKKILDKVGIDNLDNWILAIEKGESTYDFVNRHCQQNVLPEEISKRSMALYGQKGGTLKEHIRDGMGNIYIPGSSLKGAIRTAVLSSLMQEEDINDFRHTIINSKKTSASIFEKKFFGKEPQDDIFRFIHVSDAFFKDGAEIAVRLCMGLNITQNNDLTWQEKTDGRPIYDRKPQIVEAIREEETSSFTLKIDSRINNSPLRRPCLMSITELFKTINSHTLKLLKNEKNFWIDFTEKGYDGAELYIEDIQKLIETAENCETGKECILRVGHASGWDFITGSWVKQKDFMFFESTIIPKARPKNHLYTDYPFPKSRRLDYDGCLLGFVKLTLDS